MGDLSRTIETRIYAVDERFYEMGINATGDLVPFCFHIDDVMGISESNDEDLQVKGKTVVHFSSEDHITIDEYYVRFVKIFKQLKESE